MSSSSRSRASRPVRLALAVAAIGAVVTLGPLAALALEDAGEPAPRTEPEPVEKVGAAGVPAPRGEARPTRADLEAALVYVAALGAAREQRERDAFWDRLAHCETGGDWQDPGQWAGGLGIYVGTWRAAAGEEFAPRPDQATREEQIVVAERIRERWGIHAWGCADTLGL